ncbi:IS66 family insertion sequence element accessory protein TnpB [Bosea sp. (in: a-proteobacteria)]
MCGVGIGTGTRSAPSSKRLERGRFLWPSPADGVVTITPAQLGYLLEGIDWRMPQRSWRPTATG